MRSSIHFKISQVCALLLILPIGITLLGWAGSTVYAAGVSITGTRSFTFNAANFPHPDRIDNRYFPLRPGTEYLYQGNENGQVVHTTTFVTHQTKTILGIPTVVVVDTVSLMNGQLLEKTLDWYAQDDHSNVWYFGEFTTEYMNGKPVGHDGSWEAGVHAARAGIIMEGDPHVGDSYHQEFQKAVAQDMAAVLSLRTHVCVPFNCHFNKALETREWSPLEAGFLEHKWYAPGVGFVKSIAVKGGPETSALVAIKQI